MIEIKREDIKKMLVWDGDNDGVKRFVICKTDNGYWAVCNRSEEAFKDGTLFCIIEWEHAKPIPEPLPELKWRPFKADEIDEQLLDFYFRKKGDPGIVIKIMNLDILNAFIYINHTWKDLNKLFELYDMKETVDGIWHPAGVKEVGND